MIFLCKQMVLGFERVLQQFWLPAGIYLECYEIGSSFPQELYVWLILKNGIIILYKISIWERSSMQEEGMSNNRLHPTVLTVPLSFTLHFGLEGTLDLCVTVLLLAVPLGVCWKSALTAVWNGNPLKNRSWERLKVAFLMIFVPHSSSWLVTPTWRSLHYMIE